MSALGQKQTSETDNESRNYRKNQYLCGNELTIADYFGAAVVSIGELVGCDFSAYPNIKRWLDNLKRLKSWDQVNEVFNGFVAANKGKDLVRV